MQVYIIGGMDGNGTYLTSTFAYDSIIDVDNNTLAQMPFPRATFTTAVLNNTVYVIGGYNSTSAASSYLPDGCMLQFDTQANSWSRGACLVQVLSHGMALLCTLRSTFLTCAPKLTPGPKELA